MCRALLLLINSNSRLSSSFLTLQDTLLTSKQVRVLDAYLYSPGLLAHLVFFHLLILISHPFSIYLR